jgi:glucosamine--fructose-6-phosphate aminotransferase (isomerizing)
MLPTVMITQVEDLPRLMRESVGGFMRRLEASMGSEECRGIESVFLVGCGDSYHASLAAQMAFESIAGVRCRPSSSFSYIEYAADWMRGQGSRPPWVVGISASGTTSQVVQALHKANACGASTVALVGAQGSPVTHAADCTYCVEVPSPEPSPGIRTYAATVLGLMLLAIRIGQANRKCGTADVEMLAAELIGLEEVVRDTLAAVKQTAVMTAESLKEAVALLFLGSGPSLGTAKYCAAKVVEASGVFAVAQDVEEWMHVERFCYPDDMPIFLIAPPGRSLTRVEEVARVAESQGRRIVAVVDAEDVHVAPHARFVLPVVGRVREEFSPLVYQVPGILVASALATALGRRPFRGG